MDEDVIKEIIKTYMVMIFCTLILLPISILVLFGIALIHQFG